MVAALETIALSKRFGGLQAANEVALSVEPGEIRGLIGPNGAGKTTLVNLVTGVYQADSGDVKLAGRSLIGRPMHEIARLGLVRSFQVTRLFGSLTVRENLMVAAQRQTARNLLADMVRPTRRRLDADVDHALDLLGIGHLADLSSNEISQGHRKLVSAARALAAAMTSANRR